MKSTKGNSHIVRRNAGFSRCKTYRYWLTRQFESGNGRCVFVGLNPSLGDGIKDDPTIRRCMGFAIDWGFEYLTVVNLFGFRTPNPGDLKKADSPEGVGNRPALRRACKSADCIVAAWGVHGEHQGQAARLYHIWKNHKLHCLGQTRDRHPVHPLYQPKKAILHPFQPQ